ncbi:MAG: hypothetical protein Q9227_003745 [Pyrenula ochraceoflavens]
MSSNGTPSRSKRPSLGSTPRAASFLNDHQQYKGPANGPISSSIDGMLEGTESSSGYETGSKSSKTVSPVSSITSVLPSSAHSPTRIKESGIVHTMSHTACQPRPTDPPKIVATIFYNSSSPKHIQPHPDQSPNPRPTDHLPLPELPPGAAPVEDLSKYPLEPPAPEPQPLDHLYGSHISQLCLTHFLSVLDTLPANVPYQPLVSSHRCLADDCTLPRIMEVVFSPPPNPELLPFPLLSKHESLYRFEREWNVELILQPSTVFRRHKRLAVFDMDSTLIQQEVIDEIASTIGVAAKVSAITARAMAGELDFAASLRERVKLLKGIPATVFEDLKSRITITPGAIELCKCLKRLGVTMAVLSGGFQPLADWLANKLGLDHAFANHLLVDPNTNTFTGELDPEHPIVDGETKRHLLVSLAKQKSIPLEQTMAVGDGANDIPMLKTAGLGVAWCAKTKVQMEAPARLNVGRDLGDLIYLLGLTKQEVDELLAL